MPLDVAVVTTTYVTTGRMAILCVTHEADEDGSIIWQFHCGNEDYSSDVLQLVALGEILELDPTVMEVADLPVGWSARRANATSLWVVVEE